MDQQLVKQLKELKQKEHRLTPDAVWVEKNKQAMLAKISAPQSEDQGFADRVSQALDIMAPLRLRKRLQPVMTLVLVVIVSAAGWTASVSASYKALPGDLLYNVKLASEKTHMVVVGLVGDEERETELLSNAARTRAYEAKALVAQKKFDHVDETLQKSVKSLEEANKKVKEVREKKPEHAISTAGQVTKASGEVKKTFNELLDNISNDELAGEEDARIAESVISAKKDATARGLEAVEEIVNNIETVADSDEDKQQVQQLVRDAIDQVAEDTSSDVEDSVSEEEIVNNILDSSSASGTLKTSSNTPAIEDIEDPAQNVTEDTEDGGEANTVLEGEIEAAKQLVEDGQLSEALQKAKDVNEINSGIKKMSEPGIVVDGVIQESASGTEPVVNKTDVVMPTQ